MANVTKSTLKGYFREGEIPTEANFVDLIDSADGYVVSAETTQIGTGVHDSDMNLTQPAGTLLTDMGIVATNATLTVGGTHSTTVSFGTTQDGSQLATGNMTTNSNGGSNGESISMGGAKTSTGDSLTVATSAALYTAVSRTIYIRAAHSATIATGTFVSYIKFIKLT